MTDERNAVRKNGPDGRQALAPALDFHQIRTGFAEPPRILNGKVWRAATASRQIRGHECLSSSTRYGAGVVDHILHRDMGGVWMTKHNHSQGIADQQQIKPTLVEKTGSWVVVGGKRGKAASGGLGSAE
jgi:hypothetical protein